MPSIFLSYRRKDSDIWADRLASDLRQHFNPRARVFMDIREIAPGEPWRDVLDRALADSAALLVIIGPGWLTAEDGLGRYRLQMQSDTLRKEVAEALKRGVRVFPILVNGAALPSDEAVPKDIAGLTYLQAHDLTIKHWAQDIAKLIAVLEQVPALDPRKPCMGPRPEESAKDSPTKKLAGIEISREVRWKRVITWVAAGFLIILAVRFVNRVNLVSLQSNVATAQAPNNRNPTHDPVLLSPRPSEQTADSLSKYDWGAERPDEPHQATPSEQAPRSGKPKVLPGKRSSSILGNIFSDRAEQPSPKPSKQAADSRSKYTWGSERPDEPADSPASGLDLFEVTQKQSEVLLKRLEEKSRNIGKARAAATARGKVVTGHYVCYGEQESACETNGSHDLFLNCAAAPAGTEEAISDSVCSREGRNVLGKYRIGARGGDRCGYILMTLECVDK